jgi:transmembrane sensor
MKKRDSYPTSSDARDSSRRQAAEWTIRKDRGLNDSESAELINWCSNPKNAEELKRIEGTWTLLDRAADSSSAKAAAQQILSRARKRRHQHKLLALGGFFAAAAALAVGFFQWTQPPQEAESTPGSPIVARSESVNYQVVASTAKSVELPDGSKAELNGDSMIEIEFSDSSRLIRLVSGEAYFTVVKDPQRPFLVSSAGVTVRAVGTVFNVRLNKTGAVEVLVTEGVVRLERHDAEVSPTTPSLSAGEMARIAASDLTGPRITLLSPTLAEIEKALAWRSLQVIFNETPLEEVVATFNRHNEHKLVIGDPALSSRTLTGVFRADNLEGFILLLESSLDVVPEPGRDNTTVLKPKP